MLSPLSAGKPWMQRILVQFETQPLSQKQTRRFRPVSPCTAEKFRWFCRMGKSLAPQMLAVEWCASFKRAGFRWPKSTTTSPTFFFEDQIVRVSDDVSLVRPFTRSCGGSTEACWDIVRRLPWHNVHSCWGGSCEKSTGWVFFFPSQNKVENREIPTIQQTYNAKQHLLDIQNRAVIVKNLSSQEHRDIKRLVGRSCYRCVSLELAEIFPPQALLFGGVDGFDEALPKVCEFSCKLEMVGLKFMVSFLFCVCFQINRPSNLKKSQSFRNTIEKTPCLHDFHF